MKFGKTVLMSLLAVSLTSSPVLAQAAQSTSDRTGAQVEGPSAFAGDSMLIAVAVIAGLLFGLLIIGTDSDDAPVSP